MASFTVSLPPEPRIRISSRSGRVVVVCEPRSDVEVVSGALPSGVSLDVNEVRISGGSRLELRVPEGVDLFIGVISSTVEVRGRAGSVRVSTASGAIRVEHIEKGELRTFSGNVTVDRCDTSCRIATKSGRAKIGDVGRAEIATLSGRIGIGLASGPVRIKSVSGTVEVDTTGASDVEVKTMSGSITLRMPQHVRPDVRARTLSGRVSNKFADGGDLKVSVATISGRVELVPV